jgi:hypothetical protein
MYNHAFGNGAARLLERNRRFYGGQRSGPRHAEDFRRQIVRLQPHDELFSSSRRTGNFAEGPVPSSLRWRLPFPTAVCSTILSLPPTRGKALAAQATAGAKVAHRIFLSALFSAPARLRCLWCPVTARQGCRGSCRRPLRSTPPRRSDAASHRTSRSSGERPGRYPPVHGALHPREMPGLELILGLSDVPMTAPSGG